MTSSQLELLRPSTFIYKHSSGLQITSGLFSNKRANAFYKESPYGNTFSWKNMALMKKRSQKLRLFIDEHKHKITSPILEAGPCLHPLATPSDFPGSRIFYWEKDPYIIMALSAQFGKTINIVNIDFSSASVKQVQKLHKRRFEKLGLGQVSFGAIIASQVLNYIDYKKFLSLARALLNPGGLLFLNNGKNTGIYKLFSSKRPKTTLEIPTYLEAIGFEVVDWQIEQAYKKGKKGADGSFITLVARKI
ncbi:class I SAM-dependent methyltransferase [Candidatus Parvarchaeota archaeon]|nr:class I SAM-dependent methyltransferase [Candidatus Parvarchaeota archaeon]